MRRWVSEIQLYYPSSSLVILDRDYEWWVKNYDDLKEFLEQNVKKDYGYHFSPDGKVILRFEDEQDAILVKLAYD